MKFLSFNVNGIRAIIKRDFVKDIQALNPDIICIQETKANVEQVKETLHMLTDYHVFANASKARKGYSGTAILTKTQPLSVCYDMGIAEHDQEGRVITVEYDKYYLVTVYTPNSGSELARLDYRKTWDKAFLDFVKHLEVTKPVIICGDMNVAHERIDIARPDANYNKAAGFTQIEIDGMDAYHNNGLMDTFRIQYPNKVKYSWWSYRGGARENNVGWRIDYFLVSKILLNDVKQADILNEIHGSDHCPVWLELK